MTVGNAGAARMTADVGQAQRVRALPEDAEHATAARKVSDACTRLPVESEGEELVDDAVLVQDRKRRIPRAGDLTRRRQDPIEYRLRIELADKRTPGVEQAAHAERVGDGAHLGPD